MEDFVYIILLIAWFVVSLYKRNAKVRQQKAAGMEKAQPQATTALPKEVNMEEMLEEFFGGGKKAIPEPAVEIEDEQLPEPFTFADDSDKVFDAESGQNPAREISYQSWESSAQKTFNENQQQNIPAEYVEPEYKSFYASQTPDAHSEYAEVGKIASVEELIRSHAAKDAMEQARAEMEYGASKNPDIPEFDLRTAVIFSEILNKKYS